MKRRSTLGNAWIPRCALRELRLDVRREIDLVALEAHLARRGVVISNTSAAYVGAPHLHGFRIAYAYRSEEEMRRAPTIVADALRGMNAGSRS